MSVEKMNTAENESPCTTEVTDEVKNVKNIKTVPKDTEEYKKLLEAEREVDEELNKLKRELAEGPTMKETMNDLHEYNDIKDSTQIVLGAMAEMHKTTVAYLHKKYNVPTE